MSELLSGNGVCTGVGVLETTPRDFITPNGYIRTGEVFKKSDAPELYRISGNGPSSTVVGASDLTPNGLNGTDTRAWRTPDGRLLFIDINYGGENKGVYEQQGDKHVLVSDWFSETGFTVGALDHTPGTNDNELLFIWSIQSRSRVFYISKSVDYGVTWTHNRVELSEPGTAWEQFEFNASKVTWIKYVKTRWCGDRWVTVFTTNHTGIGARVFMHSKDGVNWVYGGHIDNTNGQQLLTGIAYHEPTNTVYFMSGNENSNVLHFGFSSVTVNDSMNGNLSIASGNRLYVQFFNTSSGQRNRSFEIIGEKMVVEVGRTETESIVVGFPLSKMGTFDTTQHYFGSRFFEYSDVISLYFQSDCILASNFSKTAVYAISQVNSSPYQRAYVISENPDTGVLESTVLLFPGRWYDYAKLNLIGRNVYYSFTEFSDLMDPNLYGRLNYVSTDNGQDAIFKLA